MRIKKCFEFLLYICMYVACLKDKGIYGSHIYNFGRRVRAKILEDIYLFIEKQFSIALKSKITIFIIKN